MPNGLLERCSHELYGNIKVLSLAGEVFTEFLGGLLDHLVGFAWATTMLQTTVRRTLHAFDAEEGDGFAITGQLNATDGRVDGGEGGGHDVILSDEEHLFLELVSRTVRGGKPVVKVLFESTQYALTAEERWRVSLPTLEWLSRDIVQQGLEVESQQTL
jgi:hypothetical protein